ncbi:MAG: hypothetical protein ACE5LU_26905 [Anaerolineae bacterium]
MRNLSIAFLAGFILYGLITEFIEWVMQPESPNPPPNLEATFGRVVLRWLIRSLLVLLLAVLIYAAGVTFGRPGFRAEGWIFDLICTRIPALCQTIGLR